MLVVEYTKARRRLLGGLALGTPTIETVVVHLSKSAASMTVRLGVRKRGVVGRLRKQQPGVLPTVSGDKVDKENIPL